MTGVTCTVCGRSYPEKNCPYLCECGGIFDYSNFPAYDVKAPLPGQGGVWKYQRMLGLDPNTDPVTLGEGNTALVAMTGGDDEVFLKLEYQNPTASYKDRGTAVLISFLKSRGVMEAVEDSSGNAGASFAAYAARAGIKARVYVPSSASGPKRAQIEAYGAELVPVPGPRAHAAAAVLEEVQRGVPYASHAFMPFGLTGIATISYEIVEQLGREPGTVIAPVGHGGLLYGMMKGFESMSRAKRIQEEPYYLGVQAAGCAPISKAFLYHHIIVDPITPSETIAEGVKVTQPVRGGAILSHIQQTSGKIVDVEDGQLIQAYHDLARKGFFVEPTSALVMAALQNELDKLPKPVALILTGAGTKSKSY